MANSRISEPKVANGSPRRRGSLVPVAYSESLMPALRLTRSSRIARNISKVLLMGLLLTTLMMTMAPWQQSLSGSGSVLAYAPDKRPQFIQSPVSGRVHSWGEDVYENARVVEGQVIVELRDLDEGYTERLKQQLQNSQLGLQASQQNLEASRRALTAAETVVQSFQAQVIAFKSVREATEAAQNAFVEMARKKVDAEQQQLIEFEAALPQLIEEYKRLKTLQLEGNVSLQRYQEIERRTSEQQAKVARATAYVESAKSELEGKIREREAMIQKAQVDIDNAEATLRNSNANVSKAESDVARAEQAFNNAERDLRQMETILSRQQNQTIRAPFDGFLVEINPNLGTAVLKEGDPICTIVPETVDRSVQLWLAGNDAPLVDQGRHVRLQFEGWPAVQFTGWPSVAVGTFGGEVVSVDATDDGRGRFRVLVRPDPTDHPWPDERFLRQGVRANGWVLLKQVPLWFEVWRRLNGFPPVIDVEGRGSEAVPKKPKLPKL